MGEICGGIIVTFISFNNSFIVFMFSAFTFLLIGLIFPIRFISFGHSDVNWCSPFLFIPVV